MTRSLTPTLLIAGYVVVVGAITAVAVDRAGGAASSIVAADGFEAPVGNPASGGEYATIVDFCDSGGSRGYHLGDDIDVADVPVHAAATGRVVAAGFRSGWDGVVLIEHRLVDGTTVFTQYGHLQTVDVGAGDDVVRGGAIGVSGPPDGDAVGKHLHFEVKTLATVGSGWSPHTPCPPSGYEDPAAFLSSHTRP